MKIHIEVNTFIQWDSIVSMMSEEDKRRFVIYRKEFSITQHPKYIGYNTDNNRWFYPSVYRIQSKLNSITKVNASCIISRGLDAVLFDLIL